MIVVLGLVWGGTFPIIELTLEEVTPVWLAAGRISFAALLTTAIWIAVGGKLFAERPARRDWLNVAGIGAMSTALPFIAISWGQNYVTAGFTGVTMATVALMVLPLAHVLVPGEQMNLRKIIGFLLGFAGVIVLIGPDAFATSGSENETLGQLACLFAAACYAISSVTMRRLPTVDPIGLTAVTLLIGMVIVLATALAAEGTPPALSARGWFLISILGLLPTAAASLLRVLVIQSAGPTFMSLTNYQVPIWAVALGVIFLGEPLRLSLFAAMVLILAGVALSQWGALRRLFASRT